MGGHARTRRRGARRACTAECTLSSQVRRCPARLYGPMTALPRPRSMDRAAPEALTEVQEISSWDACLNRTLTCSGWPGVTVTGPLACGPAPLLLNDTVMVSPAALVS